MSVFGLNSKKWIHFDLFPCQWRGYQTLLQTHEPFEKLLSGKNSNYFQINVLAMEYPGYSIHKGKPKTEIVNQEAKIVYDFVKDKLGFS